MSGFTVEEVLAAYNQLADEIVPDYESLAFEHIHAATLDLLPPATAAILDVGAGTGRDAAWFARQGHDVFAVEPSRPLRQAGMKLHSSAAIVWIDDLLPDLRAVRGSGADFDLIWLSAIWMHVPPADRGRAFQTLASLLRPGGGLMFSLRQGPLSLERPMATADAAELTLLARAAGLVVERVARRADAAGRKDICWEIVWLRGATRG